jgi:single-strand DNA-binding protein
MASFNKVILVGNLTRDPQVRYIPSGTAVAEIGLAVSRQWFDKNTNTRKEDTTFVDVTLWGRQAELAGEYLSKGRPVLIEGRLHLDQWDDRETGQKRSKLKVVCETMQFLGSRPDSGQRTGGAPAANRGGARDSYGADNAGGFPSAPEMEEPPPHEAFYDEPAGQAPDDEVPF